MICVWIAGERWFRIATQGLSRMPSIIPGFYEPSIRDKSYAWEDVVLTDMDGVHAILRTSGLSKQWQTAIVSA
jgi:hypothetical protein